MFCPWMHCPPTNSPIRDNHYITRQMMLYQILADMAADNKSDIMHSIIPLLNKLQETCRYCTCVGDVEMILVTQSRSYSTLGLPIILLLLSVRAFNTASYLLFPQEIIQLKSSKTLFRSSK